jgi:hypothetical protein
MQAFYMGKKNRRLHVIIECFDTLIIQQGLKLREKKTGIVRASGENERMNGVVLFYLVK